MADGTAAPDQQSAMVEDPPGPATTVTPPPPQAPLTTPPTSQPMPNAAAPQPTSFPPKPPGFENPEAAKTAQKAAINVHAKVNTQALSVRQYLESTVVPILMQGMQSLVRERPPDAVEYLAAYLLKHNPSKKQPENANEENEEKAPPQTPN
ncbi:hypothetical protein BSKO_09689 [Bryopsis sp. KO-2023]|nr:hypothetical protein BSKO_09689 [Bryopsis sp. KO-2023]